VKGPLLGPLQASVPVPVYIGPARLDGGAGLTQIASTRARKGKGKTPANKKPEAPATETAAVKPEEKPPQTVNASSGFDLTPALRKLGNTFAPAAAESKPAPAPAEATPPAKPKQAAKKKPDTKKPDAKTAESKSGAAQSKSTKQ
jgi:hypothetical protein